MNLVVTGEVDPRHIFPQRFFSGRCTAAWRNFLLAQWKEQLGGKMTWLFWVASFQRYHTRSYPISKKETCSLNPNFLLWNQLNSAWNRLQAHSNRQGPTNSERSSLGVTLSTKGQTRISSFIVGVPFLEFHFCIMGWACKRSHNMECISQRTVSKALYMFFNTVSNHPSVFTRSLNMTHPQALSMEKHLKINCQVSDFSGGGCLLPSPWHHLPRIIWPHVHTKRCATSWQHYFRHHGFGTPLELVI